MLSCVMGLRFARLSLRMLTVPAIVIALMTDRALAAEMPKDFRGTWCTTNDSLMGDWSASEGADCEGSSAVSITAAGVKSPALSLSCIVRKVFKFDVCPWGMIVRNRERARVLRPSQINPWSAGYHIVLQCSGISEREETVQNDWVIEKGSIRVGIPGDYRCPWDRGE
jgi:hypothetical protein